jgi:hypothetical protein
LVQYWENQKYIIQILKLGKISIGNRLCLNSLLRRERIVASGSGITSLNLLGAEVTKKEKEINSFGQRLKRWYFNYLFRPEDHYKKKNRLGHKNITYVI